MSLLVKMAITFIQGWFEGDRFEEAIAHLTQQGFQRFWVSSTMRMVLKFPPVAQTASKFPTGVDIQGGSPDIISNTY